MRMRLQAIIRKGEGGVCLAAAPDLAPGDAADERGPAERLLDTLSDPLADGVAGMVTITSAAAADGCQFRHVIDKSNTASDIWADSAYRSQKNEKWLTGNMMTSCIRRRKPTGRPMPESTAQANARKSAIRARVEHIFAHQKNRFGLFIHTIGIVRAEAKRTLANFHHLIFPGHRQATA
jgi:transposase, IS5 family